MNRFAVSGIVCSRCRQRQTPPVFHPVCSGCRSTRFGVVVERTATGFDVSGWGQVAGLSFVVGGDLAPLAFAAMQGPGALSPFYRTHSILEAADVPGMEILVFLQAPVEERRRMFVKWKRKENEARLLASQKVCGRCGVVFTAYSNAWNAAGLCSRICHHAFTRSSRQA
jgi:hypothetical protein